MVSWSTCNSFVNQILTRGFGEYIESWEVQGIEECTRQRMLSLYQVPMLARVLEILMNVPTSTTVNLNYEIDDQWVNVEQRGYDIGWDIRSKWSPDLCYKYMQTAKGGNNWESQKSHFIGDYIMLETDQDFNYVVASFLQYCSMDVYDDIRRKGTTTVTLKESEMMYIYAKAYLVQLSVFEYGLLGVWGQLGKVLAHFIHMAATGVFKPAQRKLGEYNCQQEGHMWRVPEKLKDLFGSVNLQ